MTDFKKKLMKKKNKRAAKKKKQFAKLCALVRSLLSSCLRSPAVLLSCCASAPVFCLASPALLLSCCLPVPALSAAFFLPRHTFFPYCRISALFLPLYMLNPPIFLGFSLIIIFRQSLLDEPWSRVSTSPAKLFFPFLALATYNPDNNNAWTTRPILINSNRVLILHLSTFAYCLPIMIKKRCTWAL